MQRNASQRGFEMPALYLNRVSVGLYEVHDTPIAEPETCLGRLYADANGEWEYLASGGLVVARRLPGLTAAKSFLLGYFHLSRFHENGADYSNAFYFTNG